MLEAVFGVVLLLLLAVSTSEVAQAATLEDLFLQPDNFEKSYWDTSYMDVIQPIGSSVKSGTSRNFVTRPLAEPSTFTRFALKLWVSTYAQDYSLTVRIGLRRHNTTSDFLPIGLQYAGQICGETGCQVTVSAGVQSVDVEMEPLGTGFTAYPGVRLELRLSSPRIFYWGDSSHPSSLTTDRTDLVGIPVPEFPETASLLSMALLAALAILAARKHTRPSETLGPCH